MKIPCAMCIDGEYPVWLSDGMEIECPDCHGSGLANHECDEKCLLPKETE